MRMNSQIDITDVLPTIQVPTLVVHRTGDVAVDVEGGRELASLIPGAKLVELPGDDHLFTVGENRHQIYQEIEEFLTGTKSEPIFDRVLATVLMTDIVGSTARAEAMGDWAWRDLLDVHDRTARDELLRFRGNEVKSLGDGFLATFDDQLRGDN